MLFRLSAVFMAIFMAAIGSPSARAADIILTIDGEIAGGVPVDITIEDLEALVVSSIVTKTPWHDNPVSYEGVSFAALLDSVGAAGDTLTFLALNNYRSEMPVEVDGSAAECARRKRPLQDC